MKRRILVACEYSGRVRDAFTKQGWDAMSCDLLPSESKGKHYQGSVFDILDQDWDMMIAHPPCTYLSNSGVRWLYTYKDRWDKMRDGAKFFKTLLDSPIKKIAIENPIIHKYAREIIGRRQDQVIQPWQYGHGETKATCLWLKGLPLLTPTDIVDGREQVTYNLYSAPLKDRAKLRSLTYQGIADAMAEQWS